MKRRVQASRTRSQSRGAKKQKIARTAKKDAAPLGQKVPVTMRYAQEVAINGALGGIATAKLFVVNGMYDPDFSGVGHQPMGFDQMCALYNRWCVYGCAYEVELTNIDQAEQQNVVVGAHVNLSSSTATDAMVYIENPETKWTIMESLKATKSTCKMTGYIDIGKVYGRSKNAIVTEDDFWGDASTNPTNKVYLHLFSAGLNGVDPDNVIGVIRLTYYALFDQYNLAAQS